MISPDKYRELEQQAKEDFLQGTAKLCGCLVGVLVFCSVVVGAIVGVVWLCKVV